MRRAAACILAVLVGLALTSCDLPRDPSASRGQVQPSPPPVVASDYPGWAVRGYVQTEMKASSGAYRRNDGFVQLTSPDGRMELLALYARSARTQASLTKAIWVNPDELFAGDGWTSAPARSLVWEMRTAHADEQLMGAYRDGPESQVETWYVGFYREENGRSLRGSHLYRYDRARDRWRLVHFDSGATGCWDTIGPVGVR